MRILVGIAGLLLFAESAHSETLAICGASKGHGYYFEGGAVPMGKGGWQADGISKGSVTLSKDPKGEYDIVFSDASGGSYSARSEGGAVIATRMSADEASFVIVHPHGSTEVYQFVRDSSGRQQLALLQSKGLAMMTKAALLISDCSLMRLK